ncbi:MAG: 50S ribosomal protein L5 [Chloroflexi bacterium]|nr:50S ribosomal protein L5 [Chloroflexota bacterium]
MAKPDEGKPDGKKQKEQKGAPPKGEPKGGAAKGAQPKGEAKGAPKEAKPAKPAAPPRLRERYRKEIMPALVREFNYGNHMQAPHITKVIVNIGMGEAIANAKALDAAVKDLTTITGQKPIVIKAKKSIATFKLREGMPIGVKVSLRGDRMYHFLDRLMSIALPRTRDFRGVPRDAFDGRGNYTLGLREQLIWPEIDYDQIDKVRGMEVSIVTSAKTDEEARRLLQLMGMPFGAS